MRELIRPSSSLKEVCAARGAAAPFLLSRDMAVLCCAVLLLISVVLSGACVCVCLCVFVCAWVCGSSVLDVLYWYKSAASVCLPKSSNTDLRWAPVNSKVFALTFSEHNCDLANILCNVRAFFLSASSPLFYAAAAAWRRGSSPFAH